MSEYIIPESDLNADYYQHLCALLEPDAIEYPRYNTFTYTVGSSETKYLIAAWAVYLNPTDNASRFDIRNPNGPMPLRNITVKGIQAGSTAIFLNPALPTYADALGRYLDRLEAIATMPTRHVWDASTGTNNNSTFLPGPYGCIITSVNCFDYSWVALGATGVASTGFPLDNELNDSATTPLRFQRTMLLPVTKAFAKSIYTGYPNNANARGVITYVILPSTWSAITDATSYIFRDDFMGSSLDTTTKWNRTQSTAGNVEIDTRFQWVKLKGNGTWGANGMFSQTTTSRAAGKVFMCDVCPTTTGTNNIPNLVVGWHDGAGYSYADFSHGIDFTQGANANVGGLVIFEAGTNRGTVGSGWTKGHVYRVRITLGSSNNATYEIQGGPEYNQIGSGSWSSIQPATSSNSTTPLAVGATMQTNTTEHTYVGDMKMY